MRVSEYRLKDETVLIGLPKDAEVLGVVSNTKGVFLLVLCDEKADKFETRCFERFRSCETFVDAERTYVGTYGDDYITFHVFERKISK